MWAVQKKLFRFQLSVVLRAIGFIGPRARNPEPLASPLIKYKVRRWTIVLVGVPWSIKRGGNANDWSDKSGTSHAKMQCHHCIGKKYLQRKHRSELTSRTVEKKVIAIQLARFTLVFKPRQGPRGYAFPHRSGRVEIFSCRPKPLPWRKIREHGLFPNMFVKKGVKL